MAGHVNPLKRINNLYDKCLKLLEQEIDHLKNLSIVEKLPSGPAKDLRDYVKLFEDMREAQLRILKERQAKKDAKVKAASDTALLLALKDKP